MNDALFASFIIFQAIFHQIECIFSSHMQIPAAIRSLSMKRSYQWIFRPDICLINWAICLGWKPILRLLMMVGEMDASKVVLMWPLSGGLNP